jgi:hypothetical protein
MKTIPHSLTVFIKAFLAFLVISAIWLVPVSAQTTYEWADNQVKEHRVWEPSTNKWVPGNPSGYNEGETAPFYVQVQATAGSQLFFQICLDLDESTTGAIAFTNIEPWNTTINPAPALPGGVPLTDTSNPVVWAAGATVDSVTYLGRGTPSTQGCPTTYILWNVEFTMNSANAYLVYGGHIAAPGDAIANPPGGTVPPDMGAMAVNGTYQARVIVNAKGGDKTVNFSSNATPITLVDFSGVSAISQWSDVIWMLLLVTLAGSLLGLSLMVHRIHG